MKMSKSPYKVTYQTSKYISEFYVDALDASFEDEIRKELRSVCYGDGRFYLKTHGERICGIVFETDDAYYVDDDFGKEHAIEISKAIARVAKRFGTANGLRA
jgi:hypothetical protein